MFTDLATAQVFQKMAADMFSRYGSSVVYECEYEPSTKKNVWGYQEDTGKVMRKRPLGCMPEHTALAECIRLGAQCG